MAARPGSEGLGGAPGRIRPRVLLGCRGGGLLWGPLQGGRRDPEVGGGSRGHVCAVEGQRDRQRGPAESPHQPATDPLQVPHLPRRLWQTGCGGVHAPSGEGAPDASPRRRRMGQQFGVHGSRRRSRRVSTPTAEVSSPGKAGTGGWSPSCAEAGGPPGDQQQEASQDRAKKKEKKVKKKSKDVDNGRNPAAAAQKEVKELFRGTGLDPREKVRRRVQKRAQKLVSRKRGKSSSRSSGSSSSSSSPTQEEPRGVDGVFAEDTKVRAVAERYPGALTVEAIAAMKRSLLTTSGEDMDDSSVKPIAVLYFRTVLAKRTSGAQSREMLNLSAALDLLIRGKPACAADLIAQRLKAQEAVSQGTAWPVAQKLEIPPADQPGLVARAELASARKEEFEEARTRWRAQAAGSGKADNKGKSKGGRGDSNPWRRDDRKDENKDKKGKGQEKKGG